MNIDQAKEITPDYIDPHNGGLYDAVEFVSWGPGETKACLDGDFTADELEAFAVIMRAGGAL